MPITLATTTAKTWLLMTIAALAVTATGCDRSCSKLADKLCERASLSNDKNPAELCDTWRDRTKRVSVETCQNGLRLLERDRLPE